MEHIKAEADLDPIALCSQFCVLSSEEPSLSSWFYKSLPKWHGAGRKSSMVYPDLHWAGMTFNGESISDLKRPS